MENILNKRRKIKNCSATSSQKKGQSKLKLILPQPPHLIADYNLQFLIRMRTLERILIL